MIPRHLVAFLLLCMSFPLLAQSSQSSSTTPKKYSRVEAREFLANATLRICQKDLDTAANKNLILESDNKALEIELRSQQTRRRRDWAIQSLFLGLGVGLSISIASLVVKWFRSVRPMSPLRKQLLALVVGALWISAAGVIVSQTGDLLRHPVSMAFAVWLYSLPGILFSGIAFWWFAKNVS